MLTSAAQWAAWEVIQYEMFVRSVLAPVAKVAGALCSGYGKFMVLRGTTYMIVPLPISLGSGTIIYVVPRSTINLLYPLQSYCQETGKRHDHNHLGPHGQTAEILLNKQDHSQLQQLPVKYSDFPEISGPGIFTSHNPLRYDIYKPVAVVQLGGS